MKGDVHQGWLNEGGVEDMDEDTEDDDEDIQPRTLRRHPFFADECEVASRGREEDDDD